MPSPERSPGDNSDKVFAEFRARNLIGSALDKGYKFCILNKIKPGFYGQFFTSEQEAKAAFTKIDPLKEPHLHNVNSENFYGQLKHRTSEAGVKYSIEDGYLVQTPDNKVVRE